MMKASYVLVITLSCLILALIMGRSPRPLGKW